MTTRRYGLMWVMALILVLSGFCWANSTILPLWPDGVPGNIVTQDLERKTVNQGEIGYSRVCLPTLEVFLPAKTQSPCAAVLVCPGGGYTFLAYTHEGVWIAERLNKLGLAAAVLKYRLPDDQIMTERDKRPLQDAQRGMQMMHEHALDWHIDPNRIGVMGFSAGGHLAASVSTHFRDVLVEGAAVEQVKPAFSILVYPVISMTAALTHKGSRNRLIGADATPEQIRYYSNELQVTPEMSPVFLLHAGDDGAVPWENSLRMYEALQKNHVPAELHLLDRGGHGFGLRPNSPMNRWFKCLEGFLAGQGLITNSD